MNDKPKISIITVSFNSEETIEDTIKSVVNQDYPNIEYIIIDGKSTDSTLAIIDKYKDRIAKVISEKDDGIFYAFNKGLRIATGDIIGILNSDDFYTSEKTIGKIAETIVTQNVDSAYGDLVYVDPVDTEKIIRYWQSKPYQRSLFRKGWMPPHPTFFCKKELYEKFGDFNTWMIISNDYEILVRFLYKEKSSAAYIPEVLVKMRAGGNSNGSLRKRFIANAEDRKSWEVNGLKRPLFHIHLKPFRKIGQFLVPAKIKNSLNKA